MYITYYRRKSAQYVPTVYSITEILAEIWNKNFNFKKKKSSAEKLNQ